MYLYDAYFYAFFFNPGSIHHRTDLTVSEDAGIEFNRNLGLLHSLQGKTDLLTIRLNTFQLIHNWAKISSTLGFICLQLATSHPQLG
jgi:hypothetical protein